MPFFILPLAIKGAMILGKAIIATKKVGVATKVITMSCHAYGTANVFAAVTFVATTVGGVYWTSERFSDIKEMYELFEKGESEQLFKKFGSLLSKVCSLGITPHSVVGSINTIMTHHGLDKSLDIARFIKSLYDIADEARLAYCRK